MQESIDSSTIAIALVLAGMCSLGGTTPRSHGRIQGTEILDYRTLDINQLACVIGSDGPYADYLERNAAGMEWPKG